MTRLDKIELQEELSRIIEMRKLLQASYLLETSLSMNPKRSYWSDVSNKLLTEMHLIKRQLQNRYVKLTDNYVAEILKEDKMVKVGCQKIPFERIEELYKAMKG